MRIILDQLYQDLVGPLVQDLCIRILLDNLCKICVSGSLCEDPLDHLYQDPVGSLLSRSCRTTSARSLSQDLCVRIRFWVTCIKIL